MRSVRTLYGHDIRKELEEEGKIVLDFFDDGCHVRIENSFVMAVNAGSENKEGAWEFLSFLLGKEAQVEVKYEEVISIMENRVELHLNKRDEE